MPAVTPLPIFSAAMPPVSLAPHQVAAIAAGDRHRGGADGAGAGAAAYRTPAKLDDLGARIERLGEASVREFQGRQRVSWPRGEARRKQIEKVEVKGDYAVLEARDGPSAVTVQHLAKTREGWKVSVRP